MGPEIHWNLRKQLLVMRQAILWVIHGFQTSDKCWSGQRLGGECCVKAQPATCGVQGLNLQTMAFHLLEPPPPPIPPPSLPPVHGALTSVTGGVGGGGLISSVQHARACMSPTFIDARLMILVVLSRCDTRNRAASLSTGQMLASCPFRRGSIRFAFVPSCQATCGRKFCNEGISPLPSNTLRGLTPLEKHSQYS